jgi:SNF2 family DNA or RNA helicase
MSAAYPSPASRAAVPSRLIGAPARAMLTAAGQLRTVTQQLLEADRQSQQAVQTSFRELRWQMVRRELSNIPVSRLRDVTDDRLKLGRLQSHGYATVLAVLDATPERLQQVPGVGAQTATQAVAAARQVATAVEDGLKFRVDLDPNNLVSTHLLAAVHRLDAVEKALDPIRDQARRLEPDLAVLIAAATPLRGRLRHFFSGAQRKTQAEAAAQRLHTLLAWSETSGLNTRLGEAAQQVAQPTPSSETLWQDFQRRAADFYGLLGRVVDLKLDVEAARGFLPSEIVAQVSRQSLDTTFLRVSLRGYQAFGARFGLVQRRAIIGDEMGLGKTIQAIATATHLKAMGATHFLVVCPASVLINWTREIRARSTLNAYSVYGPERDRNLRTWLARGDIAVTTYESLHHLALSHDVKLALLIVDEAHYAKNPAAKRSQQVAAWTQRAERVLFLTGTPMENRVEEFRNLVAYLNPLLAKGIDGVHAVAGPTAFRRAVAPVYLRRNQEDVLTELPELVQVEEWLEFLRHDLTAYRQAVRDGNFMEMRRAAFAHADPSKSAKIARLKEIVADARANGLKVVVFSYFRDVLTAVHHALGPACYGPLTGATPPAQRQQLVDSFTAHDGHAVLISQIQAGGVGLNMQAASVVVLCEPQVKPTLESQAIARTHRMGQVRTVQVHRLLVADSVDQRLLEILDLKARLFDEYARRSDVAASSPEAVDLSEVDLARRVVELEQERLAREAIARSQEEAEADLSEEEGGAA